MSARKERERGWAGVCNLIWSPPQPPTPHPFLFFSLFLFHRWYFPYNLISARLAGGGGRAGGGRHSKAGLKILEFYGSFQLVASLCQLN